MALVAFLRGVNVGGHRSFRPSVLAGKLKKYDVVNVGAAGTFVVHKPGSRATFTAELRRHLPFEAVVALCNGDDLVDFVNERPFGSGPARSDVTRFVSILSKASRVRPALPAALPSNEEWFVRVLGVRKTFVFGEYRRHMKTIGYLGKLDALFGVPATTRSWSTIVAIARLLTRDATPGR
jgi:uncharacterized protein (DUF1697 family)